MAGDLSGANLVNALRGSIYAGAAERENAAQLWTRIRSDLGLPDTGPTGVGLQTFNQIWSEAVRGRNATEEFGRLTDRASRLGLDVGLTSRAISVPTWARPLAERNNAPRFLINFQLSMTNEDGTTDTTWASVYKRGSLPGTVGAIQDLVDYEAEQLAGRYGKSLAGTSSVQILSV